MSLDDLLVGHLRPKPARRGHVVWRSTPTGGFETVGAKPTEYSVQRNVVNSKHNTPLATGGNEAVRVVLPPGEQDTSDYFGLQKRRD